MIMRLFYLHICNNLSDPKAEQIADNGRRLGSFRVRLVWTEKSMYSQTAHAP